VYRDAHERAHLKRSVDTAVTERKQKMRTYKSSDGCEKLRLHGLFLGKSTSDQNAMVRKIISMYARNKIKTARL